MQPHRILSLGTETYSTGILRSKRDVHETIIATEAFSTVFGKLMSPL